MLVTAWLLSTFHRTGSLPLLVANGPKGSGKTGLSKYSRRLIDDSGMLSSGQPRSERDLAIALRNDGVAVFDNLSGVPDWLADCLCRASDGAGFRTRKLCTDGDEALFDEQRSMIINGIDDVSGRTDLLDRCLVLLRPKMREEDRKDESELNAAFERIRGRALGALLSVVSAGLKALPSARVPKTRMADFGRWVCACESGLGDVLVGDALRTWEPGTFEGVCTGRTRKTSLRMVSAIASSLRLFCNS